ncbi:MAG: LPS assembly lipoprotein LptE [Candidatus Omnitrophica bacterium]|nr:LPS assembly lipoprotein LptE [Candidatus Omnitrophota bacterium]
MNKCLMTLSLISLLAVSGCGYTTASLLPPEFKTICVENVKNSINVAAEQSELRMYRGYRPGMETDITKAVIDRFLFDGNLKIAPEEKANLVLKSELVDYKRDSLRYDANDNVEEYRIKLIVNMQLEDALNGKVLWTEKGFAGETTYRLSGSGSKSEAAAINDAIDDLAKRIVERTIEAW